MRSLLAIVLGLGAIALVACGGDDGAGDGGSADTQAEEPVDIKQVEHQLANILSQPGGPPSPSPVPGQPAVPATPPLEVKAVKCPDGVEPKQGNEFRCEVEAGEASGDVDVTQKDDQGRVFDFKSTLKQPGVTITTKGKLDLDAAKTG